MLAPNADKHKVHMNDNTVQYLTPEEIDALDPTSYHAQESPRPRFEVRGATISPDLTLFSVWDRDTEEQVKASWGYTTSDEATAIAWADKQNNSVE